MFSNELIEILHQKSDEHLIREIEITGEGNHPGAERQHIVFGVDSDFIRHACVTMQSIVEKTECAQYHFHFITSEESESLITDIARIIHHTRHILSIHIISAEIFRGFPESNLFTKAAYYRLLSPYILHKEEKILYLDADIVCLKEFSGLFSISIPENKSAGVVREDDYKCLNLAKKIALSGNDYFNSGVLLINVSTWIRKKVTERVIKILQERGRKFKYYDQDALNVALEKDVIFIPRKYNNIIMLDNRAGQFSVMPSEDVIFLHYAGADKPWQLWNNQPAARYYQSIYARSPWAYIPFDMPKNDQQAKKMYKAMLKSHNFIHAVAWYFTYLKLRYIKKRL